MQTIAGVVEPEGDGYGTIHWVWHTGSGTLGLAHWA